MAPFPETEIMTLKRIEVALRKLDFKLLKDGAYKLHEKFHSGFRFEYLDLLKELYFGVVNNDVVPTDVKDILIPTIKDILETEGIKVNDFTQNPITNGSMQTQNFEENGVKSLQQALEDKFTTKETNDYNDTNSQNEIVSIQPKLELPSEDEKKLENLKAPFKTSTKTIAIFYGSEANKEQNARILKYKKMLSNLKEANMLEFLNLANAIIDEEKIDVADLSLIVNVLKEKEHKINLLTNSKSPSIAKVLSSTDMDWSVFDFVKTPKKLKFFPYLGLIGLFKCNKCKREHFEIYSDTTPLALFCPNCKSQMFLDFSYADDDDCTINMEYYNASLCSLAQSKIWLIINPPNDDKITMELLKNALKVSNSVEEIYITSPKAETIEKYKSMLNSTGKNVKIDTSSSALNNFWAVCG